MYEALISTMGNVSKSIDLIGICRKTHYNWLEKDKSYKEWISGLPDRIVDFYESSLHKLMMEGNPASIIFALKCKGKNRGWVERQELDMVNNNPVNIILKKQYDADNSDKEANKSI